MARKKTAPKTAAEDVAFAPEDLNFPEAPNIAVNTTHNQIHKDEEDGHPAIKQAILLGVLGLGVLLIGGIIAQQALQKTEPLTSQATSLFVVGSQVENLEGSARLSSDNGATWSEVADGTMVSSGDLIETNSASRLEIKTDTNMAIRLAPNSQLQVFSIHSQLLSVKLYDGELFARNSENDGNNDTLKIAIDDESYSSRNAGFLVSNSEESHAISVFSGTVTTHGIDSEIISLGTTYQPDTANTSFNNGDTTSNTSFLTWNAQLDQSLTAEEQGILAQ